MYSTHHTVPHPAQRFLAKGMVYRHGANVCWTALDGSCLGRASGTCSRKNCWDKLHWQLEAWELTPQGVVILFFSIPREVCNPLFWQKRCKNPWWFSVPAARWWSLAISYVNEFSTLWPISINSGWRHTEKPSGDKQDKKRYADGKTIINYRA